MQDQKKAYLRALRWCGIAALAGLMAQHAVDLLAAQPQQLIPRILLGAMIALVGFAAFAARKNPKGLGDLFVSNPFIVTVLSLLTAATIAGTLIPQRARPALFDARYGGAAEAMRWLQLDDLFHSGWLSALVGLMCLALVVIAIRRWPWTFPKWGYVATHLGPVVIVLGALIGQAGGAKGRIDVEVGQQSAQMTTVDWRTGQVARVALPFAVRLDDFRIETHEPAYRVFVFEKKGVHDESNDGFAPVLAVAPDQEKGKVVRVDERFAVRIDDFVMGAGSADGAPRHTLQLGGSTFPIAPNQTYADLGGRHVKVGAYYPHFTYDIETRAVGNASDRPMNPAVQVEVRRGGPDGELEYQGWLFSNMPGFTMSGHQNGDDANRPAVPIYKAEAGGVPEGPSVKLAVLDHDQVVTERELRDGRGNHFVPFGDGRYVAVFRQRDNEAKNYYSSLSVLRDDRAVASREIYVNDPLFFEGYAFYQANYDPENLRYSGIDVVRDPGLWLVYGGLAVMLLGVLHIFYLRALVRRRQEVTA